MRFLNFLAAPAVAPFTIAAGVALVFSALSMSGVLGWLAGGGESHHDGGHDVDADHEISADHDVDAENDFNADHGVDADHDADAADDAEHQGESDSSRGAGTEGRGGFGISNALLRGLGVGRIPVSLVWQTSAVVFGLTGIVLNARFNAPPITGALVWTVPAATVVAYAATAALARVLGPMLSSKDSEATSRRDLVGCLGVVISSEVTPSFGEVRIKDKSGHDLRVVVKLASGSAPALEKSRVVVVDYDDHSECLFVAPFDEPASLTQSESKSAHYLRGMP